MLTRKLETAFQLAGNRHFYFLLQHPSPGISDSASTHHNIHAEAAVDWLLTANRICDGKGFAKLYSLATGWMGPYVETTGYIIPTIHAFSNRHEYRKASIASAIEESLQFLLAVQYPDGAFGDSISHDPARYATNARMAFDTGQVIFGLLIGAGLGNGRRALDAACRAGDWLCGIQETDGSFVKHTFSDGARTYYSRVSNALACLGIHTGKSKYLDTARHQLRWVVRQQTSSGAFRNCAFQNDEQTVLHVIAYTIDGLYKGGKLLKDMQCVDAALMAGDRLVEIQRRDGILHGHYDTEWKPTGGAHCLTGLAQMAEVWLLMFLDTGEKKFYDAAHTSLGYLRRKQVISRSRPEIHGALFGSFPWGGKYFPWAVPNWSQKFFIDALLLEEEARNMI